MDSFAHRIWDMKYRLKSPDGTPVDKSWDETAGRVARALADNEKAPGDWADIFREVVQDFRFMPAGRILAGAGADRKVTLFNCFVMGTIPDDMGGIFAHLREAALTLQQGGGIGYDFSTLRPRGAKVGGVGSDASGPVSFMEVWDAMCGTIMSAGSRRGAMMATLRCDHPDIEEFVTAKQKTRRLTNFNLSVLATDAFMRAVDADEDWDLVFDGTVYRSVRARDLWDRIMTATYESAEPGVIFIDRINQRNNLHYCETIAATNPCGEQPLPPYGACLLGSVNLARFVENPFTEDAVLDEEAFGRTVETAIRMLDNAIDISRFPLDEQLNEARAKRRIGLGVTGLADAFLMCRVRYGSAASIAFAERWLGLLRHHAYAASIELAKEKGAFPLFDRDAYLDGETIAELDADLRHAIAEHGIRNALVTSIAPTGTISLVADNVSSGIEPVFSFRQTRTVRQPDGSRESEEIVDYAYRLYREKFGTEGELPDYFVDAQSLAPNDHLAIQAVAQRFIDSSISKTINLPESVGFQEFKTVYHDAYAMGCKGCTTYRPNPVTGAVLSVAAADSPDPSGAATSLSVIDGGRVADGDGKGHTEGDVLRLDRDQPSDRPLDRPLDRPGALEGRTYKLRWPESDHATYITINDIIDSNGKRRPFEVFINSKNMEHYAWTVALTRMISAVFRRGGEVSFVVEELKAVFDPRGGHWVDGRYVPSILAAIGEVIERHMVEIGFLTKEATGALPKFDQDAAEIEGPETTPRSVVSRSIAQCPRCGQPGLMRQEGCDVCPGCGWSRCG